MRLRVQGYAVRRKVPFISVIDKNSGFGGGMEGCGWNVNILGDKKMIPMLPWWLALSA